MTHAPDHRMLNSYSATATRVNMAREYVESTSIDWFDFDSGTRTLEIAYVSGGVYRYRDVPPARCAELRAAESKGRFVNAVIKPHYPCSRIR